MASPNVIEEITELPRVRAFTKPWNDGARFTVCVNRACADALALRHRVLHRVDVRENLPPLPDDAPSPEEKLLRAIFGEPGQLAPEGTVVEAGATISRWTRVIEHREGTLSFEGAESGVVESVTRTTTGLPKGIAERISVIVTWAGPLEVGDLLVQGDTALGLVEAIVDDGASDPHVYAGPGGQAFDVTRRLPTATQSMEARSIGPYSIVSQNPMSGQRIRPGQLAWLAENGCRAIAGEFPTFKTSDVVSRVRTYETLVMGKPLADPWTFLRPPPEPPPPPAPSPDPPVPASGMRDIFSFFEKPSARPFTNGQLATLDVELRCLGLGLTLDGHDLRLSLRPPGKGTDWTYGEVKKPETINYRTYKPEPGGLFCQKIFGPTRDYECACGKYKRMKHRGIVCETCGVEVIQSKVRRERLGHVVLPVPVVPRHLRRLVSALVGESAKEWLPRIDQDGGAWILAQLASADPAARARALPPGHRNRALLESFAASGIAPSELAWEVVPVLPPDLRPLVPLPGGRFATSDLNDLYRRVINRANRLRRLIELGAPLAILVNERKMARLAVDHLLFNGSKGLPVLRFEKRPLVSLFKIVKGRFRPERAGVRSDYSGAATVIVEARERIAVPLWILFEISRPFLYGLAEELGHATTIKGAKKIVQENEAVRRELVKRVFASHPLLIGNALLGDVLTAANVEIGEDPVIRVPVEIAKRIEVRTGSRAVLHLPLSEPAIEEARALLRGETRSTPVRRDGWMAEIAAMKRGVADRLVELAVARAEDPCETPHAAFLVGGWVLRQ